MAADYYQTLQVHRHATLQEIHDAYLRLVRAHHPDLNLSDPHAVDRFKLIQQAYEILSDRPARMRYDRALRAELNAARWRTDSEPQPRRNFARWSLREPHALTDPLRVPLLLRPESLVFASALLVSLLAWYFWRTERFGLQPFAQAQHDARDLAGARGTDRATATEKANSSAGDFPEHQATYASPIFDLRQEPRMFGGLPEFLGDFNGADDRNSLAAAPSGDDAVDATVSPSVAPAPLATMGPLASDASHALANSSIGAFPSCSILDVGADDPAYAVLKPPASEGGTSMSDQLEKIIRHQRFELEESRTGYDWSLADAELTPAIDAWERGQFLEKHAPPVPFSNELRHASGWGEAERSATPLGVMPTSSSSFETTSLSTSLSTSPSQNVVRRSAQPPPWLHDPIVQTPIAKPLSAPLAPHPHQPALAFQPSIGQHSLGSPAIDQGPTGPRALSTGSPFTPSPSETSALKRLSTVPPAYGGALRGRAHEVGPASIPTPWGGADATQALLPHRTRSAFENLDRRIVPKSAPNGMFTTPFGAAQRAQAEAELREQSHAGDDEEP